MPKLACKIPHKVALACSGGADSMSALSFLLKGRREVEILHFNHGTPGSDVAEAFVREVAQKNGIKFIVGRADRNLDNTELAWRTARYDFFKKSSLPVVMAHHLDDAIEWWIFTSLRGKPDLMPISRKLGGIDILRPFMYFKKADLCNQNRFGECEDPSNSDLSYCRNRIRSNIVPEAIKVNPGLWKTIANLYERQRA